MRDRETIDSELRRIAQGRRTIRERGGQPSIREIDELLDERLGHRVQPPAPGPVEQRAAGVRARDRKATFKPKRVLHRFALLAAVPLILFAGAAIVMMAVVHRPQPAAEPTEAPPPPRAQPSPAAPPAPAAPAPPLNVVDTAFVSALKQNGVTVPSQEYVTAHGHAVCDFLAHQANYGDAVRFVQQSSIWDADQSANFTAGAVLSYCPQYKPSPAGELQPGYQNALSDLQAVQRQMQGIEGDLQRVRDGLPGLGDGQQ